MDSCLPVIIHFLLHRSALYLRSLLIKRSSCEQKAHLDAHRGELSAGLGIWTRTVSDLRSNLSEWLPPLCSDKPPVCPLEAVAYGNLGHIQAIHAWTEGSISSLSARPSCAVLLMVALLPLSSGAADPANGLVTEEMSGVENGVEEAQPTYAEAFPPLASTPTSSQSTTSASAWPIKSIPSSTVTQV